MGSSFSTLLSSGIYRVNVRVESVLGVALSDNERLQVTFSIIFGTQAACAYIHPQMSHLCRKYVYPGECFSAVLLYMNMYRIFGLNPSCTRALLHNLINQHQAIYVCTYS